MNNLSVKDHFLTQEEFVLQYNFKYGYLETSPQPSLDQLSIYYKNEDYISHTDSKRNIIEFLYHLIKRYSLNKKLKLINSISEKGNLLDVGCGTGDFLKTCLNDNWIITGIEPNEQAREIANTKTNNLVYKSEYLHRLEKESFDVITLWHVLEHLPNLEEHIQLFNSLLKPNGKLIIAVPNFNSFDAKYYNSFWAAFDVPRHLWHFSQDSIQTLFSNFNFNLFKTRPMLFDSFYVSLLSEKYKTGKSNFIKAFFIGFKSNLKAYRTKEHSSIIYFLSKN